MNGMIRYPSTFSGLRREIDRLFDDVLRPGDSQEAGVNLWSPLTDVSETDDRYLLRMDMPGLSKEELDIELRGETLTVKGERKTEMEEKKENFHRVERSYGRFFRSFTLPQAGDPGQIQARLKDGVLTIEVPKREESKPRRIEIS